MIFLFNILSLSLIVPPQTIYKMKSYSSAVVAVAFATCSLCSPIAVSVDVAGITVSAGLSLSGTLSLPTPTTTTTSTTSGPISGAPLTYTAGAFATNGPFSSYL